MKALDEKSEIVVDRRRARPDDGAKADPNRQAGACQRLTGGCKRPTRTVQRETGTCLSTHQ